MNDHRLMQIILAPIVTEKATFVAEKNNQVAFRVIAAVSYTHLTLPTILRV